MNISFISDTHSRHASLLIKPGDMLVHCGDLTSRGGLEDVYSFAEFTRKLDFKYKVVIAGNHDFCFEDDRQVEAESLLKDAGIIYLNDTGVEIEGMKFWGSPVQPEFYNWAFNRERGSDIKKHWKLIPKNTDVLLTHGPPFGILDKVASGEKVGCEDLLDIVQSIRPKIHAFGHIHEDYGVLEKDGTIFVNACSLDEHYRVRNNPLVLEL